MGSGPFSHRETRNATAVDLFGHGRHPQQSDLIQPSAHSAFGIKRKRRAESDIKARPCKADTLSLLY